jgi:hypothetical protein
MPRRSGFDKREDTNQSRKSSARERWLPPEVASLQSDYFAWAVRGVGAAPGTEERPTHASLGRLDLQAARELRLRCRCLHQEGAHEVVQGRCGMQSMRAREADKLEGLLMATGSDYERSAATMLAWEVAR